MCNELFPWRAIAVGGRGPVPIVVVAPAEEPGKTAENALQQPQLPVDDVADGALAAPVRVQLAAAHLDPALHHQPRQQQRQHQHRAQLHGEEGGVVEELSFIVGRSLGLSITIPRGVRFNYVWVCD